MFILETATRLVTTAALATVFKQSSSSSSYKAWNLAVQSRIIRRRLTLRVAVVGSGPAGFYTTQGLLKNSDVNVDIYEKLPVPFGLVRYGVAPDHADVKNVIKSFTSVASGDRVNFYGNVSLGETVSLEQLIDAYHAVVLCYGSSRDKLLNIEGEQTSKNVISARNFVGWYNGVPEDKDLDINLNCDTVCIIGHGNVALDCARILTRPAHLEKTDITSYAQKLLAQSKIKRIYIIGRRGPLQASFTTKEMRELAKLNEGRFGIEPANIFQGVNQAALRKVNRPRRRLAELLLSLPTEFIRSPSGSVECILKFLSVPHRILSDSETNYVHQLELRKASYANLQDFMREDAQPESTDEVEAIDCGLVIRSIGYKALMIDTKLPVNHKLGAVANTDGRVHGYKGLYCSGWLATGASGVIANTLSSSQTTVKSILDDIQSNKLQSCSYAKPGFETIGSILAQRSVQVVHFNEWLRIDELERGLGEAMGKSREKLVDISQMLSVARKGK